MQVLLPSWHVAVETGRQHADFSKLMTLIVGVTFTTTFWLLVLMSACHMFGINARAPLMIGVGFVIATFSGAALCFAMADR